jgi:hypothetical protein
MYNDSTVLHSGSCPASIIEGEGAYKFKSNGGHIVIPSKMEISPYEHDSIITVDISAIPKTKIKKFSDLSSYFKNNYFTGIYLQNAYANTPNSEKWKGYLVIHISKSDNPDFKELAISAIPFQGKVIIIVEKELSVNGNWYQSCITSETLIYVTNHGKIDNMGWDNGLRAYINVDGHGSITYKFKKDSYLLGAIHHVSDNAKIQINEGDTSLFVLEYDEDLMNSFKSVGVLNTPYNPKSTTFKLVDAKIRPQLLSVQQL